MGNVTLFPNKFHRLLAVHAQAFAHRASQRCGFQQVLFLLGKTVGWHGERHLHTGNAAGVGGHVFLDIGTSAREVNAHVPGFDAHDGHHAGTEGRCHEVGGGEGFAPALVVHRGVGHDLVAGGKVRTGGAKFAVVNYT
jgi:hypothetical protein